MPKTVQRKKQGGKQRYCQTITNLWLGIVFKATVFVVTFLSVYSLSQHSQLAFSSPINIPNIAEPTSWGADTLLAKDEPNYSQISHIHVVRLALNNDFEYQSDDELAKTLFYHYVFKLGFNEPIVNIVITPDFNVYQLASSIDSQVAHSNTGGILVIGLVTHSEQAQLDEYVDPLADQILYACSLFSVEVQNVSASEYDLRASQSPEILFAPTKDLTLQEVVDSAKSQIEEKIEFVNPSVSVGTVAPGAGIELDPSAVSTIEIPFRNTGKTPIYGGDSPSIFIKSTAKSRSKFYQESWSTPLIGGHPVQDRISPLESGTVTIQIKAPLPAGEHSEEFVLVNSKGNKITEETIRILVTTNNTGQKVVQIEDTGIGYLNVRSSPSAAGTIIDRVAIGNIYIYERYENGYYYIINGDKPGWVAGRYIKVL